VASRPVFLDVVRWQEGSTFRMVRANDHEMKPTGAFPTNTRRFPITECFFNSGLGRWHGFSSPYDGDGDSESRKFHNFSREFLMESARERAREMAVFLLVLVTSAWPVIYMVISVVKLLQKGAPLDQ
jgi:hypothetical protein